MTARRLPTLTWCPVARSQTPVDVRALPGRPRTGRSTCRLCGRSWSVWREAEGLAWIGAGSHPAPDRRVEP